MRGGNGVSFALRVCLLALLLLGLTTLGHSAETVLEFDSDEQRALYVKLTKDHRCLKCQNQNLADSAAGIAEDLKREIYLRVKNGETGDQVSAYLVERYGDFVLYKPPFKPSTYALWIGPFVLLLVGVWCAVRISKQSGSEPAQPDATALSKARELLDD